MTELNDPGHPAAKAYDASANNATTYFYTRAVLGGGLNNMLMHVAQLLHSSCEAEAILVLPRLDRDPMSEPWVTKTNDDRPWLPFDHIFNFSFFANNILPLEYINAPVNVNAAPAVCNSDHGFEKYRIEIGFGVARNGVSHTGYKEIG